MVTALCMSLAVQSEDYQSLRDTDDSCTRCETLDVSCEASVHHGRVDHKAANLARCSPCSTNRTKARLRNLKSSNITLMLTKV